MTNLMKNPPMQKDAERLAAQGRFGDSMLVHMNPIEVEGIASLVPGGRLTTNPQTGQPEAFLPAIAAIATTIGALKKPKGPEAAANMPELNEFTRQALLDATRSPAFAPGKTLSDYSPNEMQSLGFLPRGVGGFNVDYGGVQDQRYANYQTPSAPGQQLAMFGMAPGQSLPMEGGGIEALQPPPTSDLSDFEQQRIEDIINFQREDQGLAKVGTFEDQVPKPDPRDYGAASVRDDGSIYWGTGHGGGLRRRKQAEYAEDLAAWERAKERYENLYNDPNEVQTARYGGIMTLANGGFSEEDFQRMNGPISGPGTETSDDIPAMLSDGEFVVNAKAVRGMGKLGGANQSKEDQRREGARMMYALQRAGEQAMKRASS